jgi:hypothetical protein
MGGGVACSLGMGSHPADELCPTDHRSCFRLEKFPHPRAAPTAEVVRFSLAVRPSRHYTQILHSEFWPVITKCERQRVGTIGRAHAALSSAVFGLNFDAAARIEFVPDARELADSGSVAQAVERFAL